MASVSVPAAAAAAIAAMVPRPTYKKPYQHQPGYQKELNDRGIRVRKGSTKCRALKDSQIYQGVYGPWSIDPADVREVVLYRTGLVIAAGSFVMGGATPFLPQDALFTQFLKQYLDVLYASGAAGLGLSLSLIHIYVTPIKLTLQAFWLFGVLGSFATYLTLALPAGQGLVLYVLDHPPSLFFVGPLFAALTGLVFKEGLCYGKLEAAVLTLIIPICLLGHLTGILDEGVKLSLLSVWIPLFLLFAARKFTQPIKDDIGDKSVFMFNALSEEEKKALLDQFEQQKS